MLGNHTTFYNTLLCFVQIYIQFMDNYNTIILMPWFFVFLLLSKAHNIFFQPYTYNMIKSQKSCNNIFYNLTSYSTVNLFLTP